MKMVKSLLLGSAAGLFAVAGAQAADLPVKAKAVEYVKICSLYGVGYYYIPGTDTCIKIGGYVRYEAYHNAIGPIAASSRTISTNGAFTRNSNTFAHDGSFPSDHGRSHPDGIRHSAVVFLLRRQLSEPRRYDTCATSCDRQHHLDGTCVHSVRRIHHRSC